MNIKTLEKNRKSILTKNLKYCIVCGMPKQHIHEVFFGRNRQNSMKWGCCIPICARCHINIHNNIDLDMLYKRRCQEKFEELYSHKEFMDIFKKNYL